jgi:para-nitrobenzyl esterase
MEVPAEICCCKVHMKSLNRSVFVIAICLSATLPGEVFAADRVKVANGLIEAAAQPDSAVRSFRGIPFALAPVGDLRWREPQPVKNWTGVRNGDKFGPRCMQVTSPGADYWFRGNGMSEDCLYLNVWTPAKSGRERLPVLVYIFGGGFSNGDGSEPRYDGESMARKGIVAVTVNYRLNIFGFFSHPELTKESPHHASGNYGFLDQAAALEWVRRNISAFGGDPKRVTIAGESAGSISVSALMASPLSRNLIAGAIGESGALIATLPPRPLAETEKDGVKFGANAGAASLAALRAMTAEQIQAAVAKSPGTRFNTALDGYFLPKTLPDIFEAGEQSKVPLLAGSNSEEQSARSVLGTTEPTPENFANAVRRLYGDRAAGVLKAYAPSTPEEVLEAATDLASARFIAYGTWKWTELQMKTGGKPVYRYLYARPRPRFVGTGNQAAAGAGAAPAGRGGEAPAPRGAAHSAEIQYAMGNLPLDKRYAWEAVDYKVSEVMQGYFVNFIKTGNPNGPGLANWPAYTNNTNFQRMRLDVDSRVGAEPHRDRYLALDALNAKP